MNTIIHPITGNKANIHSKVGRELLKKYIIVYKSGGMSRARQGREPIIENSQAPYANAIRSPPPTHPSDPQSRRITELEMRRRRQNASDQRAQSYDSVHDVPSLPRTDGIETRAYLLQQQGIDNPGSLLDNEDARRDAMRHSEPTSVVSSEYVGDVPVSESETKDN